MAIDLFEKARVLGEALRDSAEFKALEAAEEKMNANEEATKLIEEFQSMQMQLRKNSAHGKKPSDADLEELKKLQDKMNAIDEVAEYNKVNSRFSQMLESVNMTIQQVLTGEQPHVCTHCGKH